MELSSLTRKVFRYIDESRSQQDVTRMYIYHPDTDLTVDITLALTLANGEAQVSCQKGFT